MNSAVPGPDMLPSVSPASTGSSGTSVSRAMNNQGNQGDFNRIIRDEMVSPEELAKLKELLPPEQLQELESMMENGNALPWAADLADPASTNPVLLQWMLQLTGIEGGGDEVAARLGAQSGAAASLTAADLRNLLLSQGSTGASPGQNGALSSADAQTAILLAKGELADSLGIKSAVNVGDLPAGLLNSSRTTPTTPFSALVSGLEQVSPHRSGVYSPPAINLPVGEKGWDNMLGNRVAWMVGGQLQQATLHISPRHLGPIDIQISMQHDQASVSFLANNAAVKEAIEAAIPRLREMFADNNMLLANVDVGQHDASTQNGGPGMFEQTDGSAGSGFAMDGQGGREADAATDPLQSEGIITTNGLVDDYA